MATSSVGAVAGISHTDRKSAPSDIDCVIGVPGVAYQPARLSRLAKLRGSPLTGSVNESSRASSCKGAE